MRDDNVNVLFGAQKDSLKKVCKNIANNMSFY